MTRRWIIRGFFIALVLLCACAWLASGFYQATIQYNKEDRFDAGAYTAAGYVSLGGGLGVLMYAPDGFTAHISRMPHPAFMALRYNQPEGCYFGFRFFTRPSTTTGQVYGLTVPYWFPTLVSAVLLCLLWRKPRPKFHGFPVEPKPGGNNAAQTP